MPLDLEPGQSIADQLLRRTLQRLEDARFGRTLCASALADCTDRPGHELFRPAHLALALELTCDRDELAFLLADAPDDRRRFTAATVSLQAMAYTLRKAQARQTGRHYRARILSICETYDEPTESFNTRLARASADIWSDAELRLLDRYQTLEASVSAYAQEYTRLPDPETADLLRAHKRYLLDDLAVRQSHPHILPHLPPSHIREHELADLSHNYQTPLPHESGPVTDRLPEVLLHRRGDTWAIHTPFDQVAADTKDYHRARRARATARHKAIRMQTHADDGRWAELASTHAPYIEKWIPRVRRQLVRLDTSLDRPRDLAPLFDHLCTTPLDPTRTRTRASPAREGRGGR